MFRRLLKQLKRRIEGARKSREMRRFMSGRAMIHALSNSGALVLPTKL